MCNPELNRICDRNIVVEKQVPSNRVPRHRSHHNYRVLRVRCQIETLELRYQVGGITRGLHREIYSAGLDRNIVAQCLAHFINTHRISDVASNRGHIDDYIHVSWDIPRAIYYSKSSGLGGAY